MKGTVKIEEQIGNDGWPFPIPIVKTGNRWRFDTRTGRDEILNRKIAENELSAIQVCLAIVDAQRDYADQMRDRSGSRSLRRSWRVQTGKKMVSTLDPFFSSTGNPLQAAFFTAAV